MCVTSAQLYQVRNSEIENERLNDERAALPKRYVCNGLSENL
jgi:hypothetical protein